MRTAYWILYTCILASSIHGQSLAELAEKERERRQKQPTGKVYREGDLEAAGDRVSIVGVETSESEEDREAREKEKSDRDREKDREWEKVFSSYRDRYDAVKAARDRHVDQYINGIPAGAEGKRIPCRRILSRWHLPGWIEHAIACERIEEKIKEQEALLKEIETECLEAARKRGIIPGRARLR